MNKTEIKIDGRDCFLYGSDHSDLCLIQPVDDHDLEGLDQEVQQIRRLSETNCFFLAAFKVQDWNNDLSPWAAPAVFGTEAFGGRADETLRFVTERFLPEIWPDRGDRNACIVGGYSLAGLFSLWAAHQTDRFAAVAAASPSVWFPGWAEYAEMHRCNGQAVYLSLGDREERTKNPTMARVGEAIREQYRILSERSDMRCALEWNAGNHFREPDLRTAKAFAWTIHNIKR